MVSWRIPNWCLFLQHSHSPETQWSRLTPTPGVQGIRRAFPILGGPWLPHIGTHPLFITCSCWQKLLSLCHSRNSIWHSETWWQERYLQQLLRISPFSDPEPQPWFNKDCKGKSTSSRHSTQAERNSEIGTYWKYYKLCTDFKWLWLTAEKARPKKLDHKLEMIIPVSYLVTDSKHSLHCPVQIEI